MNIYVKSYGCSANIAEGEIIKGKFAEKHKIAATEKEADVIILNICTVKGDKKSLDQIKDAEKTEKKIAIAGCITPTIAEKIKALFPDVILVNSNNILKIVDCVENRRDLLEKDKPIKLLQPRIRSNSTIGIVPISSGCLDACSYCSTRQVKGILYSFPSEEIVKEVQNCVKEGCKEIWITGQDTACYGFDTGTNLAELLEKIVRIEGKFKIRIGMGNPRHIPKYLDELIKVIKNPKVFKFIHLPVQSGNDDVLKAMRRGHDVETVKNIVKKLRKEIPDITLSTDIIVGHPTETEEQFLDTLKLCKELEFDIVNIARFASRPGTPAAEMKQIHGNVKKERSRQLSYLQKHISVKRNKLWVGWEGDIIVDNKAKGGVSGRNYAYKPVFVESALKIGDIVTVRIVKAEEKFLKSETT